MATKGELAMLEKLFGAEIEGRLLQSRSQMMLRLVAKGYAESAEFTVAVDRFGPMKVKGYQLTHLGRLTYCASCGESSAAQGSGQEIK